MYHMRWHNFKVTNCELSAESGKIRNLLAIVQTASRRALLFEEEERLVRCDIVFSKCVRQHLKLAH